MSSETLRDSLYASSVPGQLYKQQDDNSLICFACGHRCLIKDGRSGICQVRFNRQGELLVPANYVAGLQCDPTEKKPFYHVYPGSLAVTFGMLGCDLHCAYCQNWLTSQALRDPDSVFFPRNIKPDELIDLAHRHEADLVVSSYNEPLITSEWAVEIFNAARGENLLTGYVSNGNATPEVLEYIRPVTDLFKIDLKSFQDKNYRALGCKLSTILDSIKRVHEMGFWLEIVTLVIPGFNDSEAELSDIAAFIHELSPAIPWHVTAFHKDYKMQDPDNTTAKQLIRAAQTGYDKGLQYVYAGNMPGRVERYENTYCHGCGCCLIERYGFRVLKNDVLSGKCPECHTQIPGVWRNSIINR